MTYTTKHPVAVASEAEHAPLLRIENAVPVALWQTRFKLYEQGDEAQCEDVDTCDREGDAPNQDATKRNFAIGHEPVAGAYVACIPVSDPLATQSIVRSIENAVFGRTNEFGWILRRQRQDRAFIVTSVRSMQYGLLSVT